MNIYCYERLEELLPHHKAAFKQAEFISFDCSIYWFENLITTTHSHQEFLKIYVADNASGQTAILPMYYRVLSGFKPKIIRTLGNFYTSLYAPICSNGVTVELLAQALQPIEYSQPVWDIIDFSPLSIEHDSYEALFKALAIHGFLTFRYFCFVNWYLPVCGRSYDEYFKDLPSRLKHTVNRKRKHFLAMTEARLEIITGGDELDLGIADYINVYKTSWKNQEPYPEFIPGLIKLCADQGWLRLGLAYLHDQPIAAQIWIVAHGRASIYKLAHDENFDSYSIGSVLTAHMMQHVMDVDKALEVDYLIGDDIYKKDWMSHQRERWGIVAYNSRTFFGLTAAFKQALGEVKRKFFSYGNRI